MGVTTALLGNCVISREPKSAVTTSSGQNHTDDEGGLVVTSREAPFLFFIYFVHKVEDFLIFPSGAQCYLLVYSEDG